MVESKRNNKVFNGIIISIATGLFILFFSLYINLSNRISNLEGKFEIFTELQNDLNRIKQNLNEVQKDIQEFDVSKVQERTIILEPPRGFGKIINGSSGELQYFDNLIGYFSGKINIKGLVPNTTYMLTLNGKPEHPSNEYFTKKVGPEGIYDFKQVRTDSKGNIDGATFDIDLPPGKYDVKLFVKDQNDWKIVLHNDNLTFKIN